jgi:hypothetical protein
MTHINSKKDRGFIALMSSIIISVILILIIMNSSFTGFYSRMNILDSEVKERSSALADACIDIALLGFAQNPLYSGNVTVPVNDKTCYISTVTSTLAEKTFTVRGIYMNSYTNLKITVDATTFAIISVEEVLTL